MVEMVEKPIPAGLRVWFLIHSPKYAELSLLRNLAKEGKKMSDIRIIENFVLTPDEPEEVQKWIDWLKEADK